MIPEDHTAHPVRDETARSQWVSTPRHYVITAVVIGALMLLATWPLPTLIGLAVAAGFGLVLAAVWAWLSRRERRLRCGGSCVEWHTYTGRCDLASLIDETSAIWRVGDGPLTGASTSGSKECTGCVGCGGPDCIQRGDGALTGDDTADAGTQPSGAPAANVEQPDEQQLRHTIQDALRTAAHWCDGCTLTERACVAAHPIQVGAWTFGVVSDIDGPIDAIAEVVLAALPGPSKNLAITAWGQANDRANAAEAETERHVTANLEAANRAQIEIEQLRATIARVAATLHDLPYEHVRPILAVLDEFEPVDADQVQGRTKQPVSDPQQVDESDPDACQVVHVDGGPVRIHGQGEMDEKTAGYFAEIVQAAKRKYAAEHPEAAQDGDG